MSTSGLQATCSAVILAGGLNSRMGGRNKAFLQVGGKTILQRLLETMGGLFEEVLIVTRQPGQYTDLQARVVTDIYPARSSLTGIHAGLRHATTPYIFVVPCDAPFIQPDLVKFLLGQIEPSLDIIVPEIDQHFEPLCAIYSKRCIAPIEAQLDRNDFTIIHFFDSVHLKTVPAKKIRTADADMISFYNVNTPEALKTSRKMVEYE